MCICMHLHVALRLLLNHHRPSRSSITCRNPKGNTGPMTCAFWKLRASMNLHDHWFHLLVFHDVSFFAVVALSRLRHSPEKTEIDDFTSDWNNQCWFMVWSNMLFSVYLERGDDRGQPSSDDNVSQKIVPLAVPVWALTMERSIPQNHVLNQEPACIQLLVIFAYPLQLKTVSHCQSVGDWNTHPENTVKQHYIGNSSKVGRKLR